MQGLSSVHLQEVLPRPCRVLKFRPPAASTQFVPSQTETRIEHTEFVARALHVFVCLTQRIVPRLSVGKANRSETRGGKQYAFLHLDSPCLCMDHGLIPAAASDIRTSAAVNWSHSWTAFRTQRRIARALGERPKLRVTEGGQRDVRQSLDESPAEGSENRAIA
jgi:hypothetical protein